MPTGHMSRRVIEDETFDILIEASNRITWSLMKITLLKPELRQVEIGKCDQPATMGDGTPTAAESL